MNAEKEIVNLWLNRQGFFTILDTNAKNRVVDIIAVKQHRDRTDVLHVEVSCSVSGGKISGTVRQELLKKFTDSNVVAAVKGKVKDYVGTDAPYEKMLVTTNRLALPGVNVLPFGSIFHDVVNKLDTQNYRNDVVRSLQLFKYVLLADPVSVASLVASEGTYRSLTGAAREKLAGSLLRHDSVRKLFRKKESEMLLIELLRESTLRSPERLAKALDSVLTKRTAAQFVNLLLRQKTVERAVKEEIRKDSNLQKFLG